MVYTIYKNWHYSFPRLISMWFGDNSRYYQCKFESSCYWSPMRNDDDYDLNKLCGYQYGIFTVHKSSIRVSWVPNFDKAGVIDLYGYEYDKSFIGHDSLYLGSVVVGEEFNISIENLRQYDMNNKFMYGFYHIKLMDTSGNIKNGIKMKNSINNSFWNKFGFRLFPYAGGNNVAIHKMKILVDKIF